MRKVKEAMNDLAIDVLFWSAFWLSKIYRAIKREED